jgi:hypothetical protein
MVSLGRVVGMQASVAPILSVQHLPLKVFELPI